MDTPGAVISREFFWNILGPGFPTAQIILYVFAAGAVLLFLYGLARIGLFTRFKVMANATGSDVDRVNDPLGRFWYMLADVFTHRKILRERSPGIAHLFIFWGFVALTVTTAAVFIQVDIISPIWHVLFMKGWVYLGFKLFANVFGILAIIGTLMALNRRYFVKPKWLDEKREDKLILWFLLGVLLTGFIVEGLRIQATEADPASPMHPYIWYSLGGRILAYLFSGMSVETIKSTHVVLWWIHGLGALGFLAFIAYSKLIHIFTAPANIFLRPIVDQPPIKVIQPEMFENAETFGIHKLEEYSWKDLFDSEACTRCGRCVEVCPAFNTDKPLNPRDVIQSLRTHLEQKAKFIVDAQGKYHVISDEEYTGPALIGDILSKDTIWSCTTCMACVDACPVYILQFPKLIELRRYMVMMESDFPSEVIDVFKGLENNSNPWGIGSHLRVDWAKGHDVPLMSDKGEAEYLFYVGCAGSYDDLNQKVAVSLAKIFNSIGLDFAILGAEEGCCGDSAKKIGNEYLFQALATANMEIFNSYKVKKIITMCPHGYNTFKHDYKELGGNYKVFHYTEILDELIKEGKLKLKHPIADSGAITYHDSCYLGRYNNMYDQPRNVLQALKPSSLIEMSSHHEKSFCCGAGGGRMWMEEGLGTRINQQRTKEAEATGAKTVCTACPFCYTMLSDGIKELGLTEKLQAVDIARLVVKAAELDD
jgi:Fe-S oxidoreductase/nitrate reductase gamma subunit